MTVAPSSQMVFGFRRLSLLLPPCLLRKKELDYLALKKRGSRLFSQQKKIRENCIRQKLAPKEKYKRRLGRYDELYFALVKKVRYDWGKQQTIASYFESAIGDFEASGD